ncbi:MAG: N-acetyl-gamma-glutamyl-phosphate reductase [Planctomycetes bacterium]|nr:N-acetyl-gamma-glutamyl-phosphate reductase [Planctomycetota bacterium]
MTPVAILGATGYAGEGAVRILLNHPAFRIVHAGSDRLHGRPLAEAAPVFAGETDLVLAPDTVEAIRASGAQAVILAKKSPEVTKVVPDLLAAGLRLVDIGAEFRLRDHAAYVKWYKEEHACPQVLPGAVYGLSEVHTDAIRRAQVVGNPGCYPTSVLLPLVPLLRAGLVDAAGAVCSVSYSGVSGAGKKFVESNNNLFYALNENLHSYKAVGHQHTGEIDQELAAAAGRPLHCTFVPHLAPITRGIHSTITRRRRARARLLAHLLPRPALHPRARHPQGGRSRQRRRHQLRRLLGRQRWAHLDHHLGDRQPGQGRQRPGGAEPQPDVRPGRGHGAAAPGDLTKEVVGLRLMVVSRSATTNHQPPTND